VCESNVIERASICFHSVGATPVRAACTEAMLIGQLLDEPAIVAAREALARDLDPSDEPTLPGTMRLHLAQVLLGRILTRLATTAN
jgi:carbon-monoxide dehydrogenase medium subunit